MDQVLVAIRQTPVASFIFLLTLSTSIAAFRNPALKERFVLRPYRFVNEGQRFTVITSGLVHADWQHLLFNMLTFYFFAFELEHAFLWLGTSQLAIGDEHGQVMGEILGHAKFFVLYFGCMVVADLTTIAKYKNVPEYSSLGASGAISGVVVSLILLAPAVNSSLAQVMILGVVPAWVFALLYIFGSYFAAKRGMLGKVAHQAHLWGTLAGILLTILMYPRACWAFVESVGDWWNGLF